VTLLRAVRSAACQTALIGATSFVGCGEEPALLDAGDDFELRLWPDRIVGTWTEIGPDVFLSVTPLFPDGPDSPLVGRFLSFLVDGEEWLGRPEFRIAGGAGEITGSVPFPELTPGRHEVAAEFLDDRGRRRRVAWDFEVIDEDGLIREFPTAHADHLRVFPDLRARGSWMEIGPDVGFGRGAGLGGVWAFSINGEQLRDELQCVSLANSATCRIRFDSLEAGRYVVRLSFTRPPDLEVIRRVEWDFTVTPR
jgi:hypothetical protein